MIGLGLGAALLASAASGIVFAPAAFGAVPSEAGVAQASDAVQEGKIALANAHAMNGVVAASAVHPGTVSTAVNFADLRTRVIALVEAKDVTAQQLAEMTDDVIVGAESVQNQTNALRDALTAAKDAQRVAEERVQAEAARVAAEEAARAAEALAIANTPEGAKATAQAMAAERYGWGEGEFSCLESLWTKESSWNYQAYNEDGGATGIPQALPGDKMATAGSDWQTNATTQISWGLDYIQRAYGSPCSAWGHSQSVNWY